MNLLTIAQLLINSAEVIDNALHPGISPKNISTFNSQLSSAASFLREMAQKDSQDPKMEVSNAA